MDGPRNVSKISIARYFEIIRALKPPQVDNKGARLYVLEIY